jgi:hypothetical protein
MVSANPANILEQWKTEAATFDLDIAGALPTAAWSIDVSLRFAGKIRCSH